MSQMKVKEERGFVFVLVRLIHVLNSMARH